MNKKEIQKFWSERANNPLFNDKSVTNNDFYRRDIEIHYIVEMIKEYGYILTKSPKVLDVGCGTGYGTRIFADYVSEIKGTDFSQDMIDKAKPKETDNCKFEWSDITADKTEKESYDIIITQRCLINVPGFKLQKKAINNIFNKLKPGGIYIMLEACSNGRENLNEAREIAGLEKMPVVPFNTDFDENKLSKFLIKGNCYHEDKLYFGFYDFNSRVLYPLSIQPEEPKYDSEVNKFLMSSLVTNKTYLDYYKKFSRTFLYVLRKF
jgi:SAM-dependent methyltransferase